MSKEDMAVKFPVDCYVQEARQPKYKVIGHKFELPYGDLLLVECEDGRDIWLQARDMELIR